MTNIISQEIKDFILFFYAKPIVMQITLDKYNRNTKNIFYDPQEPEWHSLETTILQTFNSQMSLKKLTYKDGIVSASNWKNCRWDQDDIFVAEMSVVGTIDSALGRYYKRFNRTNYFDADGKGKFATFCEGNDLDTDAVLEEFIGNAEDCTLTDFDDNFPLKDVQKKDRNEVIYNIIKTCHKNHETYGANKKYDIEVKKEDFVLLGPEEIQNILSKDLTQPKKDEALESMSYDKLKGMAKPLIDSCYAVMCKAEQDQVFLQLLHMGEEKLNGKPYIHLVSDLYARDRINYYLHCKSLIEKEFNENK
eukprot:40334_1